ncbi:MAG: glycerophosphodiester phosphodiesterase family protein, partial [Gemmatimonadota bacterium]|nr:glycerophosphodiester phosphodiesterase family protein [Gemmatimonadota bacterium]
MSDAVEIIAHRGYSAVAPENTLAALDAAIEAGATALEWDVHTAACGTPVLFHDDMVSRTTNGVGPLKRRTLEQLKAFDAGKWFGPEFEGERIPSLREALEHVRGRVRRVYSEIKGFRELEDVDRMADIAAESGMLDQTVFIAMNWTLLDRMRTTHPDVCVGYIVTSADQADEAISRGEGDSRALLDFDARVLLEAPDIARRAHDAGVDMAVWTVNDSDTALRLHGLGIRRITTDR